MKQMSDHEEKAGHGGQKVPQVFRWEMVRKALRAAEEGVYCWEIQEGQIYYTEQCLRMMGWSVDELAPNIFTDAATTIHGEDCAFFQSAVQKYIENPDTAPLRVEVRLLRQGTRRKMADMHAMEDRDLFRTLINYLPDNIYFKNRESRFVLANEATARKMGVPTPSDLIGCRDTNFFSDETTEIARREELEIMRTGVPITNRVHREKWKGGPDSWCKLSKFPWYAADGSIKGIVGISSDVTELVETQHRFRRLAEQLDERNRTLEKEIGLAREIQQALQPERIPPRVWHGTGGEGRSAKFYHVYRPSVGVAGDCFHVFPVGESAVGMLICDVMGHGVRAALIASMLRGLMEQVAGLADTPALLLSSLNRQLYTIFSKANITMFVTACYLYLDLQKQRLTLSGAGHPAPIVVSAEGQTILPPIPRSPALGLIENAMYREYDLPPEDGMKVMLYTDGLVEAQGRDGEEYGVQRVMERLTARNPASVADMIIDTLVGMRDFTKTEEQDDDICLLGVEYSEHA